MINQISDSPHRFEFHEKPQRKVTKSLDVVQEYMDYIWKRITCFVCNHAFAAECMCRDFSTYATLFGTSYGPFQSNVLRFSALVFQP